MPPAITNGKVVALLSVVLLAACTANEGAAPDAVAAEDVGWPRPGGDAGKTFYSALDQINRGNVARLGLAWEFDLETGRGQEATPVLVDGVLVVSSNLGRVYGIDPRGGKELWRFVPAVDMQINRTACCDQVNRGVAVADGLVYVGALDGILYALDLHTGGVVWQVDTVGENDRGQSITGAPEVAGDMVVIGNGGAEFGVRGYVTAYDRKTGAQRWRFYTVPRDPALGPQENPELNRRSPPGGWTRAGSWGWAAPSGTPFTTTRRSTRFTSVSATAAPIPTASARRPVAISCFSVRWWRSIRPRGG